MSVDHTPTPPALPPRVSWTIILLSTLLIFVVGARDRAEPLHDELVGAFELEVGARTLIGLDLIADDQLAAAEDDGGGLRAELAEQAVERRDTALAELEPLATSPATRRRLATVYAWLARDGDPALQERALSLLNDALVERTLDDQRDDPDVRPLLDEADADDRLMRAVLLGERSLDDAEAAGLRERLGWFGDLFVAASLDVDAPQRQALVHRAHWAYRLAGLSSAVVLLVVVLSIVLWVRRLQAGEAMHIPTHSSLSIEAHQPIYLEAFAVYLGIQVTLMGLSALLPIPVWINAVGLFASSVAGALWPFLRGVSWSVTRQTLGLHRGAGLWREVGAGLYGYVLIVPFILLGLLVAWGLEELWVWVGPEAPDASHPAALNVAFGGWIERVLMLLLAAVFAPVFEEILFRGALFGYLRGRYRFALAAGIMATIFAVLHPQGVLALPALATLAVGFAAIRQARGSLIAPMTAHAFHNGALMIGLMVLFL